MALDALWVSLKTGLIAHFFVLLVGTPAAYFLATKRFRGRGVLITLVELPLVLPPAVAGIALLALFSRLSLLGQELDALGIQIPLTQTAVVLAVTFVAAPFYVRQAIASFETVDRTLIDASRTLGRKPRADVLAHRGPALGDRPRRRLGARVGAGHRRVRGDDHVRRQPPGRHADDAPGDLRTARPRP